MAKITFKTHIDPLLQRHGNNLLKNDPSLRPTFLLVRTTVLVIDIATLCVIDIAVPTANRVQLYGPLETTGPPEQVWHIASNSDSSTERFTAHDPNAPPIFLQRNAPNMLPKAPPIMVPTPGKRNQWPLQSLSQLVHLQESHLLSQVLRTNVGQTLSMLSSSVDIAYSLHTHERPGVNLPL